LFAYRTDGHTRNQAKKIAFTPNNELPTFDVISHRSSGVTEKTIRPQQAFFLAALNQNGGSQYAPEKP
jgi:hypothetical protein